jgi:hypothetical protein
MLSVHLEDVEHVAGSGCQFFKAYSGNRISAAEMQGAQIVQCLVLKPDNWEPAVDDQDSEKGQHLLLIRYPQLCVRADRLCSCESNQTRIGEHRSQMSRD